ncbi:MAG: domain S-box protein [Acidimicrobiales bacterium]|nr:domain S-box protein [Acidimicrobiales bacterium]
MMTDRPRPTATERSVQERFEMALRAGGIGTWRWDIASGFIDWDASMEELYGFEPGTFDGTYATYSARLHPEDLPAMQAGLDRALAQRTPEYVVHHRILLPDGSVRWFSSTARLILGPDGEPTELIGVAIDVSDRREAELARAAAVAAEKIAKDAARTAQRRLEMLARVSSLLDSPLDLDETLQRVADLAIGELADWCVVDVISDGKVHHAAVAHRDPTMVAVARDMQERYPTDPHDETLRHLLRTLEPLFVPDFGEDLLNESVEDPEHRALLQELHISSYVVVPVVAGGRGVGTMLLVSGDGRRLDEDDVDLALELGRRAGAAIDKARLYAALWQTAETLQASLLPPTLPDIAGVQLSAYYRSGTTGITTGGDYYDVFRTGSDRWWMVLGDVCGKGPEAAAMTAAVRYSLHALAPDHDDLSVLLHRLNDVLLGEGWNHRFTTLVLATFRATPGLTEPAARDPLVMSVISGGHPPPLVRRADGQIEELACRGTLIGALQTISANQVQVSLHPGDTLLLYTDGATEARDAAGRQLGDLVLRELLAANGPADDPAGLTDRLAAALLERVRGGLRDDLALLTLTR